MVHVNIKDKNTMGFASKRPKKTKSIAPFSNFQALSTGRFLNGMPLGLRPTALCRRRCHCCLEWPVSALAGAGVAMGKHDGWHRIAIFGDICLVELYNMKPFIDYLGPNMD